MKKKLMTMTLMMALTLAMAACGNQADRSTETAGSSSAVSETGRESASESAISASSQQVISESQEGLSGGWETNQGSTDPDDSANSRAKEAFEKAVADLDGYDYELVAYLGSQVVAGTNYSYLVKGTPVTPDSESEYLIAVVYEDTDGNASLAGTRGLLDVSSDEDTDGGWSYNQGEVSPDSSPDVKKAFEKAMEKIDGADYDPVAYIGSQTVSGTNYVLLCGVTPVTPDAERTFCLVTVYADLDGNAEITDAADIDLSAGAYDTADGTVSDGGSSTNADSTVPYEGSEES